MGTATGADPANQLPLRQLHTDPSRLPCPAGVSTGALYLLCDGMARCDFTLTDCTVERNKLLWQAAMDDYPYNDDLIWSPDNLDLIRVSDYDYGDDSDEDQPQEVPESIKLFRSMVPWLTYTYPLLELFKAVRYNPVAKRVTIPDSSLLRVKKHHPRAYERGFQLRQLPAHVHQALACGDEGGSAVHEFVRQ